LEPVSFGLVARKGMLVLIARSLIILPKISA
jgi:hypothetical protein